MKFSKFTVHEINEIRSSQDDSVETDATACQLVENLSLYHEPTSSDANVIFYVCGAIAGSCIRTTKCNSCEEILLTDEFTEPFECESGSESACNYDAMEFLNMINRGGLKKVTNMFFMLAIHAWKIFEGIKKSPAAKYYS